MSKDSSNAEDYILMQQVAADQEEAVRVLYDRFGQKIYQMAYQLHNGDQAKAEERVQEIFVRLWKTAGLFNGEKPLDRWVGLIASRHLQDWQRREADRKNVKSALGENPTPQPKQPQRGFWQLIDRLRGRDHTA